MIYAHRRTAPTKPRISFRHRVWSCSAFNGHGRLVMGFGYTPGEAWRDFLAQS